MVPKQEDMKNTVQSKQKEGLDFLQQNDIQVSETVERYLKEDSTVLNWLKRNVFPSQIQKIVNREELKLAEDYITFKRNLFKVSCELKLEGMHEKYDMGLKKYKAHLREGLYEYVMNKQRELANKVMEEEEAFLKQIEEREKLCEKYAHLESAVKRYRERIERDEARFFQWLDKIIENYQNIIDEELTKHGIDTNQS